MPLPERVLATCQKWHLFHPGSRVLCAVSGGPDSVALLTVLHELAPKLNITLGVGHLDHGIRGRAAAAGDATLVTELAARLAVPCHCGQADVPAVAASAGLSIEQAAREARYAFLREVAAREGYAIIATGHTLDDQAETVLLALLRGAGPAGLGGIRPVARDVVRPLLESSRAAVLAYLAEQGLAYRTDETNADQSYPRNRVRQQLLPLLEKEFNPAIRETIARSAEVLRAEDELLTALAAELYERVAQRPEAGVVILASEPLAAAPLALARRAIRLAALEAAAGRVPAGNVQASGARPLSAANVEDLLALLTGRQTGASINLPCQLQAELGYGTLTLRQSRHPQSDVRDVADDVWLLPLQGELVVAPLGWSLRTEVVSSAELPEPDARWCVLQEGRLVEFTAYIALDHLGRPLSVRARRPGDRFRPQGAPGQRKLQDLMVDAKVPRRLRERLPVLCDAAGRVVAVLPLRAGEDAVVANGTAEVLVIRGRLLFGETAAMLDRSPEPW